MNELRPEYEARLAARRARVAALSRADRLVSLSRGLTALVAVVLFALSLGPRGLSPVWLLAPVAAFLVQVVVHDRILQRRRPALDSVGYYEHALARLDDRWAGIGNAGDRHLDEAHPYAIDLDLFGRGSLFELLCLARTRAGEDTLSRWLLAGAPPAVVRERQEAVRELAPAHDLREALSREGASVRQGQPVERLAAWGAAPPVSFPGWARPLATLAAAGNVVTLAGWAALDWGADPFLLALLLSGIVALLLRSRVRAVLGALGATSDLSRLLGALRQLEAETFAAQRLVALRRMLDTDGEAPSAQVAAFARLLDLLESRNNQIFLPVAGLLLWSTHLALSLESWRARCGSRIADWIEVVGEMEALLSLGAFAAENPGYVYPVLEEGGASFEAVHMAHPLLPRESAVANDVRLSEATRLLLISGSNMSGKSTLLRTVGTTVVLARAGAPVRAQALSLSPLSLGASIRIHDSLQEGASRFYAEITRLRQIMDAAREKPPLLFLLDEILHGTNSGDRRTGAEAVVKGLLQRGAVGLVTTHDLALAVLADSLAPQARNVHFEDHVDEGRIAFDYRMRDGVVQRSNAIALMRAVGLEV